MSWIGPGVTAPDLPPPALVNARSGDIVATFVEVAATRAARRRGLLGRDTLPEGAALVITRSNAVHTFGMRFPLDVIFVDGTGVVRKIVRGLRPWRLAASPLARNVVELTAGQLPDDRVQVGDRLFLAPPA